MNRAAQRGPELIDAELQQRAGATQLNTETSVMVLGRGPRMGRERLANTRKVVQTFAITGNSPRTRDPYDCNEKPA